MDKVRITTVKALMEGEDDRGIKAVKAHRFIYLVCVDCGCHWCTVGPSCKHSANHNFEVEEVWTDLPSFKVNVCWYCGQIENTTTRCKSSANGQHVFLEVDQVDDAVEDEIGNLLKNIFL